MARRRGGLGGILILFAAIGLIGKLAGVSDSRRPDDATIIAKTPEKPQIEVSRPDSEAQSEDPRVSVSTHAAPKWIRGNRIAFRDGPGTEFRIADRFNSGRAVALLEDAGVWSRVRDLLTQREGWIASRFLTDTKPGNKKSVDTRDEPRSEPVVVPRKRVSEAQIIEQIISNSVAGYSGNCPCPYNRDRAGRRCGKRSAYSRPGGAAPVCFPNDVTPAMIEAFRGR